MFGKRSDRRGSVKAYKYGDGWQARVSLGYDEAGKRLQHSKVFVAKVEAEKWIARLLSGVDTGKQVTSNSTVNKLTLAEWTDLWFDRYVKTNLAPLTAHRYRMVFELRILPALGHHRLVNLNPEKIREFVLMLSQARRADGRPGQLSGATQLRHFRALSSCLQNAVYDGIIERNPCAAVKPPREVKKEARFYDVVNLKNMLNALDNEPIWFKAVVMLALGCGLRRGEIVGLSWDDIDWKMKCIHIRHSADATKGGQTLKSPKTKGSVRTVPMPDVVAQGLIVWRENSKRAQKMVFVVRGGKWMRADTISEHWQRFRSRATLPSMTFHGLRHTAATCLLGSGIPVPTVSAILGHSTPTTTLGVYSHVLGATRQQAANVMQELIVQNSVKNE